MVQFPMASSRLPEIPIISGSPSLSITMWPMWPALLNVPWQGFLSIKIAPPTTVPSVNITTCFLPFAAPNLDSANIAEMASFKPKVFVSKKSVHIKFSSHCNLPDINPMVELVELGSPGAEIPTSKLLSFTLVYISLTAAATALFQLVSFPSFVG